jgi:phosphatidylinositol alpha-1,6-mannosyltransferase
VSDDRIIVLAPQLGGADGISEVGRQVVTALADTGAPIFAHSFLDARAPAGWDGRVRFSGADGSRRRFVGAVLEHATAPLSRAQVFVVHLNLAITALPLIWRGASMTVQLHGVEAWTECTPLQRVALRRARRMLAVSRHTAARFRDSNLRLREVPVGVCHPACPEAVTASAVPGIPPGFVLIVGRMSRAEGYKGHDVLIDAWPQVCAAVPDARLVIAGDGDDRPRLMDKASQLAPGDAVIFTGRIPDVRLARLYQDAAFFAMPSGGEGFGLVYLEAMRAARACLASPGAAEEIVVDGVTGVIVPPRREQIADAVIRLLLDPGQAVAMGRAGAARVAQEFNRDVFVRALRRELQLETAAPC